MILTARSRAGLTPMRSRAMKRQNRCAHPEIGEREHPAQARDAVLAELLVGVDNRLGVAVGLVKPMAGRAPRSSSQQLLEVVGGSAPSKAIQTVPSSFDIGCDGGREVDNREAPMAKSGMAIDIEAAGVRAAGQHAVPHHLDFDVLHPGGQIPIHLAANTAHLRLLSW